MQPAFGQTFINDNVTGSAQGVRPVLSAAMMKSNFLTPQFRQVE